MLLKMAVPLPVTLFFSVGVLGPLTIIPLPPLVGVLNANTSLPTVSAYHVLALHELA